MKSESYVYMIISSDAESLSECTPLSATSPATNFNKGTKENTNSQLSVVFHHPCRQLGINSDCF